MVIIIISLFNRPIPIPEKHIQYVCTLYTFYVKEVL